MKSLVNGADPDPFRAHFNWKLIFNADEKERLYGSKLTNLVGEYEDFDIFRRYLDKLARFEDLEQLLIYGPRGSSTPATRCR